MGIIISSAGAIKNTAKILLCTFRIIARNFFFQMISTYLIVGKVLTAI